MPWKSWRANAPPSHWIVREYRRNFGAQPVAERVVVEGKVITAAGVSAGIDMALTLAAREAGEDEARALQLIIECDPQPPYNTGALENADPQTQQRATHILTAGTQQTAGPMPGNAVGQNLLLRGNRLEWRCNVS